MQTVSYEAMLPCSSQPRLSRSGDIRLVPLNSSLDARESAELNWGYKYTPVTVEFTNRGSGNNGGPVCMALKIEHILDSVKYSALESKRIEFVINVD